MTGPHPSTLRPPRRSVLNRPAMRIRTRLALLFTILVAIILVALLSFSYTQMVRHTRESFFRRLHDRALISAQMYFEKDELSSAVYKKVSERYFHELPREVTKIYDKDNNSILIVEHQNEVFDLELIERIRDEGRIYTDYDGLQLVGLHYVDNEGDFVVVAAAYDEFGVDKLDVLLKIFILGFLLSTAGIYLAGTYFAQRSLQPMQDVIAEVNRIEASSLYRRVPEGNGVDEIAQLAITFNRLLARLEQAFELQKTFIDHAAHELRTPLTSMLGEVELALNKSRTPDEYQTILQSIEAEGQRLARLTTDLLQLSLLNRQSNSHTRQAVRLDELLEQFCQTWNQRNPQRPPLRLQYAALPDDPDALEVQGNGPLLLIALEHMVGNAYKYGLDQPVELVLDYAEADHQAEIRIQDHGMGIPPADLPHIFEPFYRGQNGHQEAGSGVGLSIARRIFDLHGAHVAVQSVVGQGTLFTVRFPANTA